MACDEFIFNLLELHEIPCKMTGIRKDAKSITKLYKTHRMHRKMYIQIMLISSITSFLPFPFVINRNNFYASSLIIQFWPKVKHGLKLTIFKKLQ